MLGGRTHVSARRFTRLLTVVPWTVNDQADIDTMVAMGVDGIISDSRSGP